MSEDTLSVVPMYVIVWVAGFVAVLLQTQQKIQVPVGVAFVAAL